MVLPGHLRVQIDAPIGLGRIDGLEERGIFVRCAGAGSLPDESICACNCARIAGLERSATIFGETRRCVTKRGCLNSQIMSPAVGIPADADARLQGATSGCSTSEKRRAKSSAPTSGSAVRSFIRRPTGSLLLSRALGQPAGILIHL